MNEQREKYPKDTAGRALTASVLKARADEKISDVHERLSKEIQDIKSIDYVYVINEENKLLGVFSIREIFYSREKFVRDVMTTHIFTVSPHTHQEKVAHLALRHNLKAIPVVERGYFLGVVPSDKILSIINKEAHEDILHFSGIHKAHMDFENILQVPLFTGIKHRLPWLLIGLFGGILAAKIIGFFEETLEKNLILAMFIPMIVYISDAIGTQIETVYVRDLSISEEIPIKKYVIKHISIAFFIAVIFSFILFLFCFFVLNLKYVSFVISLSIFLAIISGAFIALFVPYLLEKLHFDPAIGGGPFTTIISDVTSILLYFVVCSLLL